MTLRAELLRLTRRLLARAELQRRDDWRILPAGTRFSAPVLRGTASGAPSEDSAAAPASADPASVLKDMASQVAACRKCPLGGRRLNACFGVGSPSAKVMFVGEGPGFDEDHRGEPFVGKAGQLLDKILASIGLSRGTVYITNVVKCHPMTDPSDPEKRRNDRPPSPEEMAACRGWLEEQVRLIRPRIIVTLGAVASKALIGTEAGITRIRGQWFDFMPGKIPLLPTYHPAALLRNPVLKRDVWTDMKNLRSALEAQP